jgi:hypothetical protein
MEQSKAEFLEQFGTDYGYPDAPRGINEMRATGFKRLEGADSRLICSFAIKPFYICCHAVAVARSDANLAG